MEKSQFNKSSIRVKEFVQISMLAAIAFLATMSFHVPVGVAGVIHLGDGVILLAAILFGSRHAAISGSIGMGLFDLLSPYAVWAPYTFVIKFVMGLIAGKIAFGSGRKGNSIVWNIIAVVVSGIWMCVGYYFAQYFIYGNIWAPIEAVPLNILQVVGGAVIALPLSIALKNTKYFQNI